MYIVAVYIVWVPTVIPLELNNRVINITSGQSINAVEQAFRVIVAYWKTLFVQVSCQHRML